MDNDNMFYSKDGKVYKRRWSKTHPGDEEYQDFTFGSNVITPVMIALADEEAKDLNDDYDDLCMRMKGLK